MTNLHYRKFYEDELENNKALFPDPDEPFIKIPIKRGQSRGLTKSWFSFFTPDKVDESGEVTNEKVVGFFKGRIKVANSEETKVFMDEKEDKIGEIFDLIRQIHQKLYKSDLEFQSINDIASAEKLEKFSTLLDAMNIDDPRLIEFFKDASYDEVIKKQLLSQTPCLIQLYVLEGYDFASRDIGSFSDPYMIVRCGSREFSERDNYQLDEANPKIYKLFEFTANFPGAPMLEIEAWDYDDLFGDDLIGKTSIDLDDRFFNGDWQAIEEKPIEYRQIYHDSTSLSQGVIQCWLEIEPSNKQNKLQKVWDIAPEPIKDYQIRLSVMDTKNVPVDGDYEGVSDVFVRCYVDDTDKKDTDTHFRCSSGAASFNYRLMFDVQSPRQNPLLLVMQAWDFDIFKSNDYICEWTLDLDEVFKNVRLTQQPVTLNDKYYDAFLAKKMPPGVNIKFSKEKGDDTFTLVTYKDGKAIELRLDLRIMPATMAKVRPLGSGRENPNMEPYLPPPVGRIEFSLNPFKMLVSVTPAS